MCSLCYLIDICHFYSLNNIVGFVLKNVCTFVRFWLKYLVICPSPGYNMIDVMLYRMLIQDCTSSDDYHWMMVQRFPCINQ